MLIAQVVASYSLIQMLILAIIVAGVVGIAFVAMRQMGVTVPPWFAQIAWIVVVVVVAIFAIKALLSMV